MSARMLGPSAAVVFTFVTTVLTTGCTSSGPSATTGNVSPAASTHTKPSSPADAAVIKGTWSGTWTRVTPPVSSGTYTWVLHQSGQQITGTLTAGQSACLTKGPLTGQISGAHVILHAVTPAVNGVGQAQATYHGVLAGTTLSGTGIVKCSVGVGLAHWKLTRQ